MSAYEFVSTSKYPGYLFSPALESKGNHRRRGDHRLPAFAMVSSYLYDDISLSEIVGNQVNELAGGSQFLRHAIAFQKFRGVARSPAKRKRTAAPISERGTYLLIS